MFIVQHFKNIRENYFNYWKSPHYMKSLCLNVKSQDYKYVQSTGRAAKVDV